MTGSPSPYRRMREFAASPDPVYRSLPGSVGRDGIAGRYARFSSGVSRLGSRAVSAPPDFDSNVMLPSIEMTPQGHDHKFVCQQKVRAGTSLGFHRPKLQISARVGSENRAAVIKQVLLDLKDEFAAAVEVKRVKEEKLIELKLTSGEFAREESESATNNIPTKVVDLEADIASVLEQTKFSQKKAARLQYMLDQRNDSNKSIELKIKDMQGTIERLGVDAKCTTDRTLLVLSAKGDLQSKSACILEGISRNEIIMEAGSNMHGAEPAGAKARSDIIAEANIVRRELQCKVFEQAYSPKESGNIGHLSNEPANGITALLERKAVSSSAKELETFGKSFANEVGVSNPTEFLYKFKAAEALSSDLEAMIHGTLEKLSARQNELNRVREDAFDIRNSEKHCNAEEAERSELSGLEIKVERAVKREEASRKRLESLSFTLGEICSGVDGLFRKLSVFSTRNNSDRFKIATDNQAQKLAIIQSKLDHILEDIGGEQSFSNLYDIAPKTIEFFSAEKKPVSFLTTAQNLDSFKDVDSEMSFGHQSANESNLKRKLRGGVTASETPQWNSRVSSRVSRIFAPNLSSLEAALGTFGAGDDSDTDSELEEMVEMRSTQKTTVNRLTAEIYGQEREIPRSTSNRVCI